MKQFIYLDTDIVNSIVAQKEKGLVSEFASESEDCRGETSNKSGTVGAKGTAQGSLFKIAKAEADLSLAGSITFQNQSQLIFKEIATKTLHDAAFDIAYEQISSEYILDPDKADLGSFIEMNRVFEFVDLEYIDKLFSKNGFIDFLKKTSKEKIETDVNQTIAQSMDREQQRRTGSNIKKEIQKLVASNNKQYDDIADIIKAIKQIIPYTRMLVSYDGFVIPLEDQYFRDNPKTMGFKHGGEITCVGYITNIIGKDTAPIDDSVFATLQYYVNEVIRALLPTKEENLYIVHPIGIFYGK